MTPMRAMLLPCCVERSAGIGKTLKLLVTHCDGLQHESGARTKPKRARSPLFTDKIVGDPSRIRTCNPRSRNPLLYPVELWDRNFEKPELHSIANMKNPLPGQARSEPFSQAWRQSLSGGRLSQVRRQRNATPQPAAGVARVGYVACDFFATPFRRHESVTF
jgi:hypothetical protein